MYTLLLSLGTVALLILIPTLLGLSLTWTVLPATLIGIFLFVWISRRISKRVEAVTSAAEIEMAQVQQLAQRPGAQSQVNIGKRFDAAIQLLQRGFLFERWQIGVGTMLNARIGILWFTRWIALQKGGLVEAIPYLEKARIKGKKAKLLNSFWPAWAMLAVAYYKGRKETNRAIKVLEESVQAASKEGLLWSLYAWILWKEKRLNEAIDILARAREILPDDSRIAENLNALQNRKKMRMRDYGEQWYQFGLERPNMAGMKPQMGHPRMRRRR